MSSQCFLRARRTDLVISPPQLEGDDDGQSAADDAEAGRRDAEWCGRPACGEAESRRRHCEYSFHDVCPLGGILDWRGPVRWLIRLVIYSAPSLSCFLRARRADSY